MERSPQANDDNNWVEQFARSTKTMQPRELGFCGLSSMRVVPNDEICSDARVLIR